MRWLTWGAIHATHWAVLYLAFVEQQEGAMNVLKFMTWALALVVWVLLAESSVQRGAKEPAQHPLREHLSTGQAWVQLLALAWFGHAFTAAAWLWVLLVLNWYGDEVKKARSGAKAAGEAKS